MDVQLDDPEATPAMKALQIRYQQAIARVMMEELSTSTAGMTLCMINALAHHLVIAIQLLRQNEALKADAIERIVKRLEIHLRRQ